MPVSRKFEFDIVYLTFAILACAIDAAVYSDVESTRLDLNDVERPGGLSCADVIGD